MRPNLDEIVRVTCLNRGIASASAQYAIMQRVYNRLSHYGPPHAPSALRVLDTGSVRLTIEAVCDEVKAYERWLRGLDKWPARPRP